MLVVTRRPGEAIIIELPTGELIEVVVLSIKGNQVKLGTDAPEHLPVVREELLERVETCISVHSVTPRWHIPPLLAIL